MSKENSSPTERIFGSKTRAKLLELFFQNPTKSFYVREITRVIGEQITSVRRELMNLETVGVIKNEAYDNKIYYSANTKHPYARALTEIFTAKIERVQDKDIRRSSWEEYTKPVKRYLKAFVLTNRLPGQEGIDMLIIGDDRTKKLTRWAEIIEKKMGKPMNYVIMTAEDFVYRRSVKDRFLQEILEMEITELIDSEKIVGLTKGSGLALK